MSHTETHTSKSNPAGQFIFGKRVLLGPNWPSRQTLGRMCTSFYSNTGSGCVSSCWWELNLTIGHDWLICRKRKGVRVKSQKCLGLSTDMQGDRSFVECWPLQGQLPLMEEKIMFLGGSSPKRNCLQLGWIEKVCTKKSKGFLQFLLE